MRIVGVDGCKKGWFAVVLDQGHFYRSAAFTQFFEILTEYPDAAIIAVDIPISMPTDARPRRADVDAGTFLGVRRNSVFRVPPRAVLEAPTHKDACEVSKKLSVMLPSQQSYALREKVLEVDACVLGVDRVFEIHPEVSFRALALFTDLDAKPLESKKTWAGSVERTRLLERAGIRLPRDLIGGDAASPDDVLDAAIAAWTGGRIATGEAKTLPAETELDARGRPVAIWY